MQCVQPSAGAAVIVGRDVVAGFGRFFRHLVRNVAEAFDARKVSVTDRLCVSSALLSCDLLGFGRQHVSLAKFSSQRGSRVLMLEVSRWPS